LILKSHVKSLVLNGVASIESSLPCPDKLPAFLVTAVIPEVADTGTEKMR